MEKRGLAKRLQHLGTETSFWVSKEASERRLEGKKTYDLHIGDLNFSTAPQIVQATIDAINNGKTTYAPPRGIPALLETVARVIGEERGMQYTSEEVCIQPGGKPIIGKFLQCVMNEGDEVLYPSPGYPIYESQIDYLGGVLKPYVYRETPEGFVLDLDQMRGQITPKTKVLIYNNYHNPTGHASTDEEMAQIAQIAIEHDLWVLSDEAYFHFVFDESKKNRSIAALPGMKERTVLLITTSKSWAMTGWRVGAALGPKNVIDMFAKLTTNDEACTCHPLQWAAIQTFGNPEVQQLREVMFQELKARRDLIHELVNQIPGFNALLPPSTFYTFINITKAMEILNCTDYEEFRKRILHSTGVSFCTREHFGASLEFETQRYIRFAFSGISQSEIREALSVLKTFMESALIPN